MDIVLWQKFNQYPDLKQELLATGDAELVEVRLLLTLSFGFSCLTRILRRMDFGAEAKIIKAGTSLEKPFQG
jgi:hypothetical protein